VDTRDEIQRAAERVRGAPVRFVKAMPVEETYRGAVVWEGEVSEFESAVGMVYAWAVEGPRGPQFAAVLRNPPVDSPLAAVRAWLDAQVRKP
jgi:hypothetical protein